ncbi:MAG: thioesterase family protein [Clostridia bacterium]|nr:thioesterase family protein [Clostridia bacterium]
MDGLNPGVTGESKVMVSEKNTAVAHGSGGVDVFATPAMIGLMENAALNSVQSLLAEGLTTVGTKVDVKHLVATPTGMEVIAKSELVEVDGKRLVFKVEAFDAKDKIGEGLHERFVVDLTKFMEKTNNKG